MKYVRKPPLVSGTNNTPITTDSLKRDLYAVIRLLLCHRQIIATKEKKSIKFQEDDSYVVSAADMEPMCRMFENFNKKKIKKITLKHCVLTL